MKNNFDILIEDILLEKNNAKSMRPHANLQKGEAAQIGCRRAHMRRRCLSTI